MTDSSVQPELMVASARLPAVGFVALGSFLFSSILEYSLPLYFAALPDFPRGIWADLVAWQVAPWCFAPILAGLLARRYGERRVWAGALIGQALVPLILAMYPRPVIVPSLAFWSGFTGALMWVGGVSLAQLVPPKQKGFSNGLIMTALGIGSLVGPLVGRAILWNDQIGELYRGGGLRDIGLFLADIIKPQNDPALASFKLIFWLLVGTTLVNAVVIGLWGQRPGRWRGESTNQNWQQTARDLKRLIAEPRYWALVGALCMCGGPLFQATNQFLRYRAEDVGLIVGSQDRGWIVLHLIRMSMWVVGGAAVGLLAGRRAGGIVAAVLLGAFAAASAGIGLADTSRALFAAVIFFEFVRQFMRWSHAGYMAEQMPSDLRATAIGGAIAVAGISSTIFGFAANNLASPSSPSFYSPEPFYVAAALGVAGAAGLLIFDRFIPIRQS